MARRVPECSHGLSSRRDWLAASALAAAGLLAPALRRATAAEADQADSSPRSREEAIAVLPLDQMTAETRRKLMAVIERPTMYRRLPQKSVDCDPDLYLFLIRNPEVVVGIWEVMGVSNMVAERTGAYAWRGDDGTGTKCDAELVYGTDDLHIIYSDGFYEGALFKRKLTGRCVLILQSAYVQGAGRRWFVGNRLDMFLQLDNTGADLVARTLSPWVGSVADTNFTESCKFASRISLTAEQHGPNVQKLADKLKHVQQPVKEEFVRVSANTQQRAAIRDAGGTPAVRRG
jgi:hypothetical protein